MRKNEGRARDKIKITMLAVAGMLGVFQWNMVSFAKTTSQIGSWLAPLQVADADNDGDKVLTTDVDVKTRLGYEQIEEDAKITMQDEDGETSGSFGNGFEWEYSEGVLNINGLGEMPALPSDGAPWKAYKDEIVTVNISDKITTIASNSFYGCTHLVNVIIPDSVTRIGDYAFCGCSSLETAILSENVSEIGYAAYADCKELYDFQAPGLKKVGEYALQSTSISQFVITSEMNDFPSNCCFFTFLEEYVVEEGNTNYKAIDGVLYSKDEKQLIAFPCIGAGNVDDETYKPVDRCDVIAEYAFAHTRSIKKLQFNHVSSLGEGAFADCPLTGELIIPDSVSVVDKGYTFYGCIYLTSVTFGKGFDSTVHSMFENCTGLETINFGNTICYLDTYTFKGCDSLTEVRLPDRMNKLGGCVFNHCDALETFYAKNLEAIQYADFAQCYKLKKVELGNVKNIQRMAFYNCPALTAITLPKTICYVDENAFSKAVKITCFNKELVAYGTNGYHYGDVFQVSGTYAYDKAFEVLNEVNKQRKAAGLQELKMEQSLLDSAMLRAMECQILFAHTRPDGSACYTINNKIMAENIAIGQNSAAAVMTAWMNSQGHKTNILNDEANTIGIGCVRIGNTYSWVQVFGTESVRTDCKKPANKNQTAKINVAGEQFSQAYTAHGSSLGDSRLYHYELFAITATDKMRCKATTKVTMYLENPEFEAAIVPIENIAWSTKNVKVATIDAKGTVTGIALGKTDIVGKTKYYSDTISIEITGCDTNTVSSERTTTEPVTTKITKNSIKKYRPVILSLKKSGKTKIKINIQKVKGVTGYQIRYSAQKSFKKAKTVTVKKTTKTIKRPKKGKKCYVKVRCYIKKNGKTTYSKWSKVSKK